MQHESEKKGNNRAARVDDQVRAQRNCGDCVRSTIQSDCCQCGLRPPTDAMIISSAEACEDLARIFRFWYDIYIAEMGKPMPGADHNRCTLSDGLDSRATHLYAHCNGEILGTLRIVWGREAIPDQYRKWYALERFNCSPAAMSFTGRFMVAESWRKTLRGSLAAVALACEAFRLGRSNGIEYDFIHTTTSLVPFF